MGAKPFVLALPERRQAMKLINKIFWLIWCVCICYFLVLLYTINHGRGYAGGTLMLFSQLFVLVTIAICAFYSKRTALTNLIVAAIFNTILFFSFTAITGESRRLLLMLSIFFINGCQGTGLLLYMPIIIKRKRN